jgi:hypothetical protein
VTMCYDERATDEGGRARGVTPTRRDREDEDSLYKIDLSTRRGPVFLAPTRR